MIGIDTFSWQKLILLMETEKWQTEIIDIIHQIDFFITTEGKKEFEYRFPEYVDLLFHITILPVLETSTYDRYLLTFDATDASLLEYNEIKGYRIISEDRPLLAMGAERRTNITPLLDFLFELGARDHYFTKNELNILIRTFRSWKNISKLKERKLKERLREIV